MKIINASQALLREARDPLAEWLDKERGSTVTENSIFTKLPQYWESEYHKDMDALNVKILPLLASWFEENSDEFSP